MKTWLRGLLGGLAVCVMAQTAQAQQFTMKLSSPTINDVTHEWMKAFKAGVEERSKGKIKVEIYPANQLGQIPATVEGVAMGTIEMTFPAIGFYIGLEPRFQTLDANGLFDSTEHGQKVLADPEIRKRLASFGEAQGVEPLVTFLSGQIVLATHKPIRTIDDFKGLKLRTTGGSPMYNEPFLKLGASPLSLPLGEVLPNLQNKAIDGAMANMAVIAAFKYFDITKYATYLPGSFTIVSGLTNRRFLKSLGPELEAIVRDEARKHETLFTSMAPKFQTELEAAWKKGGGELITFSPDETKRYLDQVTSVIPKIVGASPKTKEDYDAFLAAAKKYR
ncbi:TRAP transporter substrate-binding protein [Methylocella sp. CPCC 101449]|uniref:TRAP transporter substrate-binding protein n=1 Tax=Methylocella sp. CPCC 101449 TaxID=2987531 RepID=UPI00288D247C|nr:TRAP transporter substrate-binding protein [Methylocella sp. CPCC 101449]MDT2019362.1 TRAP transporter substrate-binding protein [Methylocella sp. CPCC 101449]HEV2573238.1 TRAP transporter substrate-binding protein [Beijerinckiaceae bacterium]